MENTMRYALITGATSGIGYELARLFAGDHFNLVIVARTASDLSRTAGELKSEFNVDVITISADLFDKEAAAGIYNEVQHKGIAIEVLVNNAGQGVYGEFLDTDLERETDIIHLNISAYVSLTKYFLKEMVSRGRGRILNVGSIAGEAPGPYHSVYHGTKAFVNSWTEALRNEVKDKGIIITLLLPGATDTDFFEKADMQESKLVKEGSLGDAEKVAKDGYEALMSGRDKVISGFKNKAMVGMANVLPDSAAAEMMKKQQEPSKK